MRKILVLFLFILFFVVFPFFSKANAAFPITLSPTSVVQGQSNIRVTITGLSLNADYKIRVPSLSNPNGDLAAVVIHNCTIDTARVLNFNNNSCQNGTFIGDLLTKNFTGLDPTKDYTFTLMIFDIANMSNRSSESFTITHSQQPPSGVFNITSINPGGSSTSTPAKAGDTISVGLSDVTISGQYRYGLSTADKFDRICEAGNTCTLDFVLKSEWLSPGKITYEIVVADSQGHTKNATLYTVDPVQPPVDYGKVEPPCKNCDVSIHTAVGDISTTQNGFVKWILGFALSISGGILLILLILAGYKLMASQGDPEKIKEAREGVTSAVIGLLFIIFSLVILEVIGINILNLPGFAP